MINLRDLTIKELKGFCEEIGEKPFRAKQIFSWIYKEVWNFDEMKNLPKNLKEKLKNNFYICIIKH